MSRPSALAHARRLAPNIIGVAFGGLWATGAVSALAPRYRTVALTLSILITLGCVLRLWSMDTTAAPQKPFFRSRGYLVSVAFEAVALVLVNLTFPRLGLASYLFAAVGFIVGLHFIGLWRASGSRRLLGISAGMCLVSLLSAILPLGWRGFNPRFVFLGVGNALVLWIGALGE